MSSSTCTNLNTTVASPGNATCVQIYGISTITPSEHQALDCRGYTVSGYEVESNRTRNWSTRDANIVTVNKRADQYEADITGIAPGQAYVDCQIVNYDGSSATGSALITVSGQRNVASVSISPTTATFRATRTQQLTATVVDQFGQTGYITGVTYAWTSDNPAVATVSASGLVTGVTAGTAHITVTANGVASAPVTMTILDAPAVQTVTISPSSMSLTQGASQNVSATLKDQDGAAISAPITWTTGNAAIASLSVVGSWETVTGGSTAGQTTISATAGGVTSSIPVTTALKVRINGPSDANGGPYSPGSYSWTAVPSGLPSGGVYTYQWQMRSNSTGGVWTTVGSNSATYTKNVGSSTQSFWLRVTVSAPGYVGATDEISFSTTYEPSCTTNYC